MIPNKIEEKEEKQEFFNKTFKLDIKNLKLVENLDGQDAMIQAIHKILSTERYAYEIYGDNYGIELEKLIGKDLDYVLTVIENIIKEALIADDRVYDVVDIKVENVENDSINVSFNVITIYGNYDIEMGVVI